MRIGSFEDGSYYTLTIYTSFVNMNDFLRYTQKVIYFICVVSLIIYFTYYILPSFINMFPTIINRSDTVAKNVFLFPVIQNFDPIERNYGIFWEPGAFQIFINLVLLIELFYFKSITKKRFIIYCLTIITTLSTTGVIVFLLICIFYYLNNNQNAIRKVKIFISVCFFLYIISLLLPDVYFNRVFGKLTPFLNFNMSDLSIHTPVRIKAVMYPMLFFIEQPLFGVGLTRLINSMNDYNYVMTFTFLNMFSSFGIIYGCFVSSATYMFFSRFCNKKWEKTIIFIIFIVLTCTEELSKNIVFFIIILYGFNYLFQKRSSEGRSANDRK